MHSAELEGAWQMLPRQLIPQTKEVTRAWESLPAFPGSRPVVLIETREENHEICINRDVIRILPVLVHHRR